MPVRWTLNASVVALNVRDGSCVWASGESSASYATPLPIQRQGRSLVVTPLENSIAAFDVDTGKHLWEIEFSEGYDEHSAAPIYREPFLCVSSPFRAGVKCYRLADDQEIPSIDVEEKTDVKVESNAEHARPGMPIVK